MVSLKLFVTRITAKSFDEYKKYTREGKVEATLRVEQATLTFIHSKGISVRLQEQKRDFHVVYCSS
jgi:hypothetical protein